MFLLIKQLITKIAVKPSKFFQLHKLVLVIVILKIKKINRSKCRSLAFISPQLTRTVSHHVVKAPLKNGADDLRNKTDQKDCAHVPVDNANRVEEDEKYK